MGAKRIALRPIVASVFPPTFSMSEMSKGRLARWIVTSRR